VERIERAKTVDELADIASCLDEVMPQSMCGGQYTVGLELANLNQLCINKMGMLNGEEGTEAKYKQVLNRVNRRIRLYSPRPVRVAWAGPSRAGRLR
jgi:hypothetical protein